MISTFHNVALGHLGELRRLILRLAESGAPSYPTMNVGGWKTDEKFFETPHHTVMRLKMELERHVLGLKFDGWAMVNREGTYHPRHQHTNVLLSGIYYVDPGDPPLPTRFETEEFDTGRALTFVADCAPGTLVTFPEGVWHHVPIYNGTRPRITIALNAKRELNR